MPPTPDPLHVLYVGDRPGVAADLPAEGDATFLTTVTDDPAVAVARLAHTDVDCVVCDERVLADADALVDRLADRPEGVPVVLQPAGEERSTDPVVPDATLEGGDPAELARLAERTTPSARRDRAFWAEPAFLATVYDGLTELFLVFDADGRLAGWNERLNEVTGRSDAALRAADPTDVVTVDGEGTVADRLARLVAGPNATVRLDVVGAEGAPIPFEFSGSTVRDGDERFVCAIGRDVSERVATAAELDEAIEDLERSNAELEQFAYVASHDLNEPLRMVSSYLQLLQRRYGDSLDEEATEFVEFAVDGAERMRDMVDALLAYSRVGRQGGSFGPVDLEDVLDLVQQNLAVAIEEGDATVEVGDLPTVRGDRSQLVELFQNLVANAVRYAGDEPPHVEVTSRRDGERWVVAVADEGIGIPEDRIDRIFDLFYRSEVHESTGIGLAMAEKIAVSHGGRIDVESTPGEGTTFFVELPGESE
jgi:PAS domain S-box-containing protein